MSDNKRYYWLKLMDDFFDSKRIKKLRKMAGGDTYTIIYLKMQLLSLKNGGILEYTGLEDDFYKELALDLDEDEINVQTTILYLLSCGLLQTSDNIEYELPFVQLNIGSETASTQRSRECRNRQKIAKNDMKSVAMQQPCNKVQQNCNVDIDIDKDIDIKEKVLSKDNTKKKARKSEIRKRIIDYLNQKTGSRFRATSKMAIRNIDARLGEGYSENDFYEVIDRKTSEWLADPKMSQYLTPDTLFGTKFEKYLNQKVMIAKNEKPKSQLDYLLSEIRKGENNE